MNIGFRWAIVGGTELAQNHSQSVLTSIFITCVWTSFNKLLCVRIFRWLFSRKCVLCEFISKRVFLWVENFFEQRKKFSKSFNFNLFQNQTTSTLFLCSLRFIKCDIASVIFWREEKSCNRWKWYYYCYYWRGNNKGNMHDFMSVSLSLFVSPFPLFEFII